MEFLGPAAACIAVVAEAFAACTAVVAEAFAACTAVAAEAFAACIAVVAEAFAACTAAAKAFAAYTAVVVEAAAVAEARGDPYLAVGKVAERGPHPLACHPLVSELLLGSGMESWMLPLTFPTACPSFLQQLELASVPSALVPEL